MMIDGPTLIPIHPYPDCVSEWMVVMVKGPAVLLCRSGGQYTAHFSLPASVVGEADG